MTASRVAVGRRVEPRNVLLLPRACFLSKKNRLFKNLADVYRKNLAKCKGLNVNDTVDANRILRPYLVEKSKKRKGKGKGKAKASGASAGSVSKTG